MSQSALFPSLDADKAARTLRAAGLTLAPADLRVERRDERWAVFLPGERIAWFAATARGAGEIAIERRVLKLLAERCSFGIPRLLQESPAGFDLRAMVPGRCDPWALYHELESDIPLARKIGGALGEILAEQHTRIGRADVAGWVPEGLSWPEPKNWIMQRLPKVTGDSGLMTAASDLLDAYEKIVVAPIDRVLVHGDLGLHNLALDPLTKDVHGVFDYSGAGWADRHHDFRYMVLDRPGEELLDAALAVYEPATGRSLDRRRIWLYNAACAASFLAFRHGVAPETRWCGRTLEEDLRWVRSSLAHAIG